MKKFNLLFITLLLLLGGCKAQQESAKAEGEKAEQQIMFEKAVQALNNGNFTLQAEYVTIGTNSPVYVNSTTNFITQKGDKAIIQVSPIKDYPGPNGMGGVTIDGIASKTKMTTDKKGNITYTMRFSAFNVPATVVIKMFKGSNYSIATLHYSGSAKARINGALYPTDEVFINKGSTL